MKNLFFLGITLLLSLFSRAQGITQSASGQSSFLTRGVSGSFDILKTDLNFSATNIAKNFNSNIDSNGYFVFGINLSAENETNIGGLFSRGDLVPAASINGFLGWSFGNGATHGYREQQKAFIDSREREVREIVKFENQIARRIIETETNFDSSFKEEILKIYNTDTERNIWHFISILEKTQITKLNSILTSEDVQKDEALKTKISRKIRSCESIIAELNEMMMRNDVERDLALQEITAVQNSVDLKGSSWELIPHVVWGITGSSFNRFSDFDTTNLIDSFVKQDFRGGYFGFGTNFVHNQFMFGARYVYEETNNFALLSKTEYIWKSEISANGQSVTQTKEIKGYSGTYDKLEINRLRIDLLYKVLLKGESVDNFNYVLLNGYSNVDVLSRKKGVLPNSINLGLGAYFFKGDGKFMGGLYVELPDVENNYEKLKPIEDQNLRKPFNRLSFGIVTTYQFNSLLNRF